MNKNMLIILLLFLGSQTVFGQLTYLHLSEQEMQRIVRSPELVDDKIRELQKLSRSTNSVSEKISALQTVILLEPNSRNVQCELELVYDDVSELLMSMDAADAGIMMTHKAMDLGRFCDTYTADAKYNHLGKLGSFHLIAGNLDSSLHYFQKAERLSDTVQDPIWHASSYNNLGIAWDSIGQTDSSYSYYNRAIFGLDASDHDHQVLLGSITDNLAHWHKRTGNYTVALQLFAENHLRYRGFNDTLGVSKSVLGAAGSFMEMGELTKADAYLDTAASWLLRYSAFPNRKSKQVLSYQLLRKKLCLRRKDLQCALKAAEDALVWQQRLDSIRSNTKQVIIGSFNQAEIWRYNREMNVRKGRQRYQQVAERRLKIIEVLGAVIALLFIVILWVLFRSGKTNT